MLRTFDQKLRRCNKFNTVYTAAELLGGLPPPGGITISADPAMRGGGATYGGPKNCGINFFTENFTGQLSCERALR